MSEDLTLEAINKEIDRISQKALKKALGEEDIKKLESFIRMRNILIDKPTKIYVRTYEDLTDKQVLDTIKFKNPERKTRKKRVKKTKDKE